MSTEEGTTRGATMLVQVMQGKASDPDGIRRLAERWNAELRPGARGFLGSTGGVAADGTAIVMARFENENSARANSDRPEQDEWFANLEKCFDGPISFSESTDVDVFRGGGADDAEFLQVMMDTGADPVQIRGFDAAFERVSGEFRPDLLGGIRIWTAPGDYIEFAYFTSQAEARAGEQAEPPAELADSLAEFQRAMANVTFIDLPDPILF